MATTQKVVDHSNMKLGKLPVKMDPRTLKFGVYLAAPDDLPPVPDSYEWGKGVKHWGMFKNDVCEDCTIASQAHMIMAWADATGEKIGVDDSSDLILGLPKKYVYAGCVLFAVAITGILIAGSVKRKNAATK